MEQEILNVLFEIRGILLFMLSIFILLMMAKFIALFFSVFEKSKTVESKAEKLFNQGQFDKVIFLCKQKLKNEPNHPYSIWWLAKTKYSLKSYEEAEFLFKKLLELEPNWDAEYIEPYLDKLSKL